MLLSETKRLMMVNNDWSQYEYDGSLRQPGRMLDREMIYCARLSIMSYFTARENQPSLTYNQFFPEHREEELLGKVFDQDCAEQVHQVCGLFFEYS
jgi:hypothetical protein